MRTRIGSPFLLTIISIFSILFFATSIAAQQASDMPPIGSSSGMPPVGGQSPAQNALALAQAAKLAADQQVTTAQGTLESAQSAVQTAEQTLTTAQETLASATSALQEAESAVEAETQQKAELIRVAEQAVQQAEQQLQTAQQELDAARSALQELEQQIATAQGTVTTAESKTGAAVKAVNDARAKLAQLMGNSSAMPPMGNNSGMPPINAGGPIELSNILYKYCEKIPSGLDEESWVGTNPLSISCDSHFAIVVALPDDRPYSISQIGIETGSKHVNPFPFNPPAPGDTTIYDNWAVAMYSQVPESTDKATNFTLSGRTERYPLHYLDANDSESNSFQGTAKYVLIRMDGGPSDLKKITLDGQ
jgi:hypothetical protein